jgi:hypothetical protein
MLARTSSNLAVRLQERDTYIQKKNTFATCDSKNPMGSYSCWVKTCSLTALNSRSLHRASRNYEQKHKQDVITQHATDMFKELSSEAPIGSSASEYGSRDSSLGLATGYALESRAGERDSCLLHSVQTDSAAHPASYPVGSAA